MPGVAVLDVRAVPVAVERGARRVPGRVVDELAAVAADVVVRVAVVGVARPGRHDCAGVAGDGQELQADVVRLRPARLARVKDGDAAQGGLGLHGGIEVSLEAGDRGERRRAAVRGRAVARFLAHVRDREVVRFVRALDREEGAGCVELLGHVERAGHVLVAQHAHAHAGALVHRDPVGHRAGVAVVTQVAQARVGHGGGALGGRVHALRHVRARADRVEELAHRHGRRARRVADHDAPFRGAVSRAAVGGGHRDRTAVDRAASGVVVPHGHAPRLGGGGGDSVGRGRAAPLARAGPARGSEQRGGCRQSRRQSDTRSRRGLHASLHGPTSG